MAKNTYRDSAFGPAVYPHLNEPDRKFNPDNPLFKTGIRLSGEAAANQKALIDAAAQEAFDDFFKNGDGQKIPAPKRKEWSVYQPYEEEYDDAGNPTGTIVFDYKQNAIIRMRDGTMKTITIGLYDAAGKEMSKLVRGGSEIRVNYSMRPITMTSAKRVGVRLDFSRVQVRKLSEGNGGGFGAVEGYEDDGFGADPDGQTQQGAGAGGGDY